MKFCALQSAGRLLWYFFVRCPVFGDELVIGYFGQSLLRHQSAESASGAKQQRITPIQLLYQISAANGTDEKLHNFSG